MEFQDIEKIFHRSLFSSFEKKNFLVMFLSVFVCGIFISFCRAISSIAGPWLSINLLFLPIFLSSGILAIAAVFVGNMRIEKPSLSFQKIILKSLKTMVNTLLLLLPSFLVYLLLSTLLGLLSLLKAIPFIGKSFFLLLSFAPFLLTVAFVLLSLVNLCILFYVTPYGITRPSIRFETLKQIFSQIKKDPFIHLLFLLIAVLPPLLGTFFLSFCAHLSTSIYVPDQNVFSLFFHALYIALPFSFFLAPFLVFFFNVSLESFFFLERKKQTHPSKKRCTIQL